MSEVVIDPPTLVSLTAYAAAHGVSKQAAGKWKDKGYLTLREGKVWVEKSDATLEHASLGRYSDAARAAAKASTAAAVVNPPSDLSTGAPPEATPDAADALGLVERLMADDDQFSNFIERMLDGHYASPAVADCIKANALAAKRLFEARRLAGTLVELTDAEHALFEAARLWRDAWLNFPTRIGPLLAADLGVDAGRAVELLTAHVHTQIAELGEPDAVVDAARIGAEDD